MDRMTRLPARFAANTKYVVEARGPIVRRYIELPDGRTLELSARRAATCHCADIALVPAIDAGKRGRPVIAA